MKFNKAHELKSLIGNTPLLEIHLRYKGEDRVIYTKAESLNMTGSIKDRMAFHILNSGYEKGTLQPGMQIFEATSGNTGISVAALGRAFGHQVNIFMPDWMSMERINLIKSLGAKITLVSKEEGGFLGSIEMAKNAAALTGGFVSSQFSNEDNTDAHYLTTGPEIWWQMKVNDIAPHAFVAGVGSGGTVMGVGKYLKERNPAVKIHPLEPANSPTLSTGHKTGKHRIQGISDEFIPSIVHLQELDEVISVDDGDAIIMSQKLAAELGLAVGISSGANFIGALMAQNQLGKDKIVVTVFPDSNKKYLSTDLLKEEPVKEGFISTDVELLYFSAQKRVCKLCFSPEEAAVEYMKTY
ncbi:MAG: cysteine synthase family protein [Saprospiraceae bacterium]|uniref:cysteine synthase n=1 Tax=Candidatus Opimibacter skivensis TaxID=2982028 RepID=A0A9D7XW53_9BACT|nr:cysteine synthase family protein [Candidatus Opimibacter skivensis]